MAYISADGNIGGQKTIFQTFRDFIVGILGLIGLFFTTITNPQAIEQRSSNESSRTYAQRNQGRSYRSSTGSGGRALGSQPRPRGSNIRGVKDLGTATCAIGGG